MVRWLGAVGLGLIVSVVGLIGSASAGTTSGLGGPGAGAGGGRQQQALTVACGGALSNLQAVAEGTVKTPVKAIETGLLVTTPGTVTGRITFMRTGNQVTAARAGPGLGIGCIQGSNGRGTRVVSTLREHFARAGSYTLVFKLNATGRRMLARHRASLSFAVSIRYRPSG